MPLTAINTHRRFLKKVETPEVKTSKDETQEAHQSFAQAMYASASNTQRAIGGMQSQTFHTADIQSRSQHLAADLSKRHVEDKKHLETHENAHQVKIDRLKAEFQEKFRFNFEQAPLTVQASELFKLFEKSLYEDQKAIDMLTKLNLKIGQEVQFPPVNKLKSCLVNELNKASVPISDYLAERASSQYAGKKMERLDVETNASSVFEKMARGRPSLPVGLKAEQTLFPLINALHACSSEVKEEK